MISYTTTSSVTTLISSSDRANTEAVVPLIYASDISASSITLTDVGEGSSLPQTDVLPTSTSNPKLSSISSVCSPPCASATGSLSTYASFKPLCQTDMPTDYHHLSHRYSPTNKAIVSSMIGGVVGGTLVLVVLVTSVILVLRGRRRQSAPMSLSHRLLKQVRFPAFQPRRSPGLRITPSQQERLSSHSPMDQLPPAEMAPVPAWYNTIFFSILRCTVC